MKVVCPQTSSQVEQYQQAPFTQFPCVGELSELSSVVHLGVSKGVQGA